MSRLDAEDRESIEAELGYRVGSEREARMHEWYALRPEKEAGEKTATEYQRLVWSLQQRKYWKAKNPVSKARIYAYRRAWAKAHPERMRAMVNKSHRKLRAKKAYHDRELAKKRAKQALATAARKRAAVMTCAECGVQWCFGVGRIPCRPKKYCTTSCQAKVNYRRMRARGTR